MTVFENFPVIITVNLFDKDQVGLKFDKRQIGIVELNDDILTKATLKVFLMWAKGYVWSLIHTFRIESLIPPDMDVLVLFDRLNGFL